MTRLILGQIGQQLQDQVVFEITGQLAGFIWASNGKLLTS